MSTLTSIAFILGIILVIGLAFLATKDASRRGFSEGQVFLLRVSCVIFFPIAIILYFIFRPALKQTPKRGEKDAA